MHAVDVGPQHLWSYLYIHGTAALADGDTASDTIAQKGPQLGKAVSNMVGFTAYIEKEMLELCELG